MDLIIAVIVFLPIALFVDHIMDWSDENFQGILNWAGDYLGSKQNSKDDISYVSWESTSIFSEDVEENPNYDSVIPISDRQHKSFPDRAFDNWNQILVSQGLEKLPESERKAYHASFDKFVELMAKNNYVDELTKNKEPVIRHKVYPNKHSYNFEGEISSWQRWGPTNYEPINSTSRIEGNLGDKYEPFVTVVTLYDEFGPKERHNGFVTERRNDYGHWEVK